MLNALAVILHLVAINIWLGGTFFSVVVLHRAVSRLESAQQKILMDSVLRRFFVLIWLALTLLLTTGGWMIYSMFGGLTNTPLYILLMGTFALIMMLVFLVTFFGPYRLYRQSSEGSDLDACLRHLGRIRRQSVASMLLGLCIVVVIGGGPHLPA